MANHSSPDTPQPNQPSPDAPTPADQSAEPKDFYTEEAINQNAEVQAWAKKETEKAADDISEELTVLQQDLLGTDDVEGPLSVRLQEAKDAAEKRLADFQTGDRQRSEFEKYRDSVEVTEDQVKDVVTERMTDLVNRGDARERKMLEDKIAAEKQAHDGADRAKRGPQWRALTGARRELEVFEQGTRNRIAHEIAEAMGNQSEVVMVMVDLINKAAQELLDQKTQKHERVVAGYEQGAKAAQDLETRLADARRISHERGKTVSELLSATPDSNPDGPSDPGDGPAPSNPDGPSSPGDGPDKPDAGPKPEGGSSKPDSGPKSPIKPDSGSAKAEHTPAADNSKKAERGGTPEKLAESDERRAEFMRQKAELRARLDKIGEDIARLRQEIADWHAKLGITDREAQSDGRETQDVKTPETVPAVWRGPHGDQPVEVIGSHGKTADGREFMAIKGSKTGIPRDQLEFNNGDDSSSADAMAGTRAPESTRSGVAETERDTSAADFFNRQERSQTGTPISKPKLQDNVDRRSATQPDRAAPAKPGQKRSTGTKPAGGHRRPGGKYTTEPRWRELGYGSEAEWQKAKADTRAARLENDRTGMPRFTRKLRGQ